MAVLSVRGVACLVSMVAAIMSAGCAGSSEYMHEIPPGAPLAAAADKGVVVFVRDSALGFAINFAILDQNGRWLGDAVADAHFAVSLPPGDYMFVGWAENTAALKATIAPGRIYYVNVEPEMGFGSARVSLEAITPRSDAWKYLPNWLKETKRLQPLPTGTAYIDGRHDDAMKRVASAKENWDEYSPEDKEERTLHADDGQPGVVGP